MRLKARIAEWNRERRERRVKAIVWPPPKGSGRMTSCPMVPISMDPGRR
jgi:hypothetical protein